MYNHFRGVLLGMAVFGLVAFYMEPNTDVSTSTVETEKPSVILAAINSIQSRSVALSQSSDI